MDRYLSPRIAYWLSAFDPDMEAVAAEVATLRRRFCSSVAWGLSHRRGAQFSWQRGYCLHPRLHLLFRGATRLLEPAFQLNHIFGSLGDWFYLEGARRRPTILTMAAFEEPVDHSLLERVDRFVVEYPRGVDYLHHLGIAARRVSLIFPPVDLERFTPAPEPEGPFTVVFASSPDRESWLEARGIPQVLEAAALRPQIRFRLVWRPWGDSLPLVREWIGQRELSNVTLVVGRYADMARHYRAAHVTVAPFTRMRQCKPAPNSLVESMACGRPVVATDRVGLAELIGEKGAGVVCDASPASLAEALDQLQSNWGCFSAQARRLAERCFGMDRFLEGYGRLYQALT